MKNGKRDALNNNNVEKLPSDGCVYYGVSPSNRMNRTTIKLWVSFYIQNIFMAAVMTSCIYMSRCQWQTSNAKTKEKEKILAKKNTATQHQTDCTTCN